MGSISTAVGLERRSRVSGYKIKKGFFSNETENLPQIIAIFGEANSANQAGLTTDKVEVTSAQEAADKFGYGSPIHQVMRILRPIGSNGVGGIPTIVFPQVSDVGASATVREWTVTGPATANATHTVVINGRSGVDNQTYRFSVSTGDTDAQIATKIADAINGVLGSPVTAVAALGVVTLTSKWEGATSADLNVVFDLNDNAAGVSYSETDSTDGAGTVDLADSLAEIQDQWVTCVINTYGEAELSTFENFNGKPDPSNPTGRYEGLIFKPFMAFFGSTLSSRTALEAITDADARVEQVTNVLCPAPRSNGWPFEAAANAVSVYAPIAQNTPHLTVNNKAYPDMPLPVTNPNFIGDMGEYNNRDLLVKKGCSTVILDNGLYKIQDLVTTYHPSGEVPLQYAYARNLNIDWNVSDAYRTLEEIRLKDRVLVRDEQVTAVSGAIKPKEWVAVLFEFFDNLAQNALINEPGFSKDSLQVQISETNPDRFETFFRYKRTGIARIESTDVEAGF
jgi:phage tail sheath gpL-like